MGVLGSQQFLVTNNPQALEQARLANLGPAGYDPTDRDRLFIHYNSKAGNIELNPTSQIYGSGRANTFGGQYSFDPASDYLNTGFGDQMGRQPLQYHGQGLDQPITGPQGPGGALYNGGLRIAMPSVSDVPDTSVNGVINCPTGFYQVGAACAPGVTLNPNDPNNILGINSNLTGSMNGANGWGSGQYQDARGAIIRVITPVKTELGKLFQIVSQVQNIGNQPGKFTTKVTIPTLGINAVESNSIMVSPGQTVNLLQSLQMPTTLPEGTSDLISVQSDLYVTSLRNTNSQPVLQYSNTATLPKPGVVLGNPPPTPPLPNIPIPPNGQPLPTFPPLGAPPGFPQMPLFPTPMYPFLEDNNPGIGLPEIHVFPDQAVYPVGSPISIVGTEFSPGEAVVVQLYSIVYSRTKGNVLKEKLKSTVAYAGANGTTNPVSTTIPSIGGSGGLFGLGGIFSIGGSGADPDRFMIVMKGNTSNKTRQLVKGISGVPNGQYNNGFGISIGGANGININL